MMASGKYLIIHNDQEEELQYCIADFLMSHGNTVIIQNNLYDEGYYQRFLSSEPRLVHIGDDHFSNRDTALNGSLPNRTSVFFHFSNRGVFSNIIPSPHKLFHFDTLSMGELKRFFSWCLLWNMFSVRHR